MGYKRHSESEEGRREGHTGLFELATRQHGVVSTRQLKGLGYGRSSAAKAHRAGRLRRVHRGVYAVGHEVLDWRGWCMAAVLAASPAVASHLSAAYLWDLLRFRPTSIDVTAPSARRQRPGFRTHWTALDPSDVSRLEGIPCTAFARTVLDLAATLRSERFEQALERAEELRILDLAAIEDLLGRVSRHPGVPAVRRALAGCEYEAVITRSAVERRFLDLVRAAGLPRPAMNYNVAGLELDAYWGRERLAVELDAYGTHGGRVAFERDRLRQEDLMLSGIAVARVTANRLEREPKRVVERLAALLERRRRELGLS